MKREYNTMSIAFILSLMTLLLGCSNQGGKKDDALKKDNIGNDSIISKKKDIENVALDFFELDKKIELIDQSLINFDSALSFLPPTQINDTSKLVLYHNKNKPVKLTYTTFEDSGTPYGLGAFYFDEEAYSFANKLSYDTYDIIEIYTGNHKVIKYQKSNGQFKIMKVSPEIQQYREALASINIDNYMQKFPNFTFVAPLPSDSAPPILKTDKEVIVYSEPDTESIIIKKIPAETSLKFIKSNRKAISINERSWLWYNVLTLNNEKGWIFGHPDFITIYGEETD